MSENKVVAENHGCIVCGKSYRLLVVYTPAGQLVGCTVTSGAGHCVPSDQRPLVACDTHAAQEIERATLRWLANFQPEEEEREER